MDMYADKLPETLFAKTVNFESKGVFVKPENKPLTSSDVDGALGVLVKVYADPAYPMTVEIDKSRVANIDSDNTQRVTYWYYMLEDFTEVLDKPDEPYYIVIGDRFSIHV